ncbi:unnamed protein product [Ranitomeya imitator]|uniref:Uncharacterized protein n=1 Tax=Ranitomeya imitator TaxID=111125 RepID=A0ABN9LME9_9NEOB|nr:unnamed protein product [Ranitomeya imitator]
MVHRFTLTQASTDLNGQRHRFIQSSRHRKSHHDILKGFRETLSENRFERSFIPLRLLYYAGHGYENYGNSFMVPIDAPKPYGSSHCLCVHSILKLMQEKETGLNVFLLDMCRKRNQYDDTILITENLKVTANIVFGYATCQGAEAFEIQHSDLANGIFMKFLKKRLLENKKVTVLLDEVGEDMGRCLLTKGMQALEIRSSLSARRALTDPIQHKACSPESLARNLQWAKANELPESMCIEFNCGVKIKLGFAAEFSNVMIIYSQFISKPPDINHCTANVGDFPLDLYIDPKETNKDTPEETGSFLVSKNLPKHCLYTRLSSLQKLKDNLTFTVYLTYTYKGVDDMMDERKTIDVGKPLVAKLGSHSGVRSSCTQPSHIPHSSCTQPSHIPHSPCAQPSHLLHSPSPILHSPCHSPEAAASSSSIPGPSHLFPNPQYPQSPIPPVYQPNFISSLLPDTRQQYYSGYPTSSGRRAFSEYRSLYSNVPMPRHSNVPEESTEDNLDFGY